MSKWASDACRENKTHTAKKIPKFPKLSRVFGIELYIIIYGKVSEDLVKCYENVKFWND